MTWTGKRMHWSGWQLQSVSPCLSRADQCKYSSSRLTPRLRPTCQRKQSSFVQCGASRAEAATSLAELRGRRQAAAVKPEDVGPGLVTSSAGKLASDTQRDGRAPLLHARAPGSVVSGSANFCLRKARPTDVPPTLQSAEYDRATRGSAYCRERTHDVGGGTT